MMLYYYHLKLNLEKPNQHQQLVWTAIVEAVIVVAFDTQLAIPVLIFHPRTKPDSSTHHESQQNPEPSPAPAPEQWSELKSHHHLASAHQHQHQHSTERIAPQFRPAPPSDPPREPESAASSPATATKQTTRTKTWYPT